MDIASMLEVEVKEGKETDSKENVTPQAIGQTVSCPSTSISEEEKDFYKLMFGNNIATVRLRRIHCTGCDIHIGSAPAKAYNMFEHPVLRTLLCAKCREFYGDGTFEQGEDATDMFCRWCANGGNLYCCSYCSNTFCYKCIKRNFDPLVRKKIEDDEHWKCFVCNPRDLYTARAVCWALLQYIESVTRILQSDQDMSLAEIEEKMNLDETRCCPRKRKRKRRRTGSNSEEDDETYVPGIEEQPLSVRRKMRRGYVSVKSELLNGSGNSAVSQTAKPSTDRSSSSSPSPSPSPSFIPCKQLMVVENKNVELPDGDRQEPSPGQPFRYVNYPTRNSIAAVPTANLLSTKKKGPTTTPPGKTRPILPSLGTSSPGLPLVSNSTTFSPVPLKQSQQNQHPQPKQHPHLPVLISPKTPMVAIPTQSTIPLRRPRVLLPKPNTLTIHAIGGFSDQNVIQIDSDSDESVVVESNNSGATNERTTQPEVIAEKALLFTATTISSNKDSGGSMMTAVPLQTIESAAQPKEDVQSKCVHIDNVIQFQTQKIENVLRTLRIKLRKLEGTNQAEGGEKDDMLRAMRLKTKRFHEAIWDTVSRLSEINDAVIVEYKGVRKSRSTSEMLVEKQAERKTAESDIEYSNKSENGDEHQLPLDMTCVDSDAESDETIDGSGFIEVNILSKSGLKRFEARDTVDQCVGPDHFTTADKSVQAYDVLPRDYEKCVGYSLLTKPDYEAAVMKEAMKPVLVPDQYFGQYLEQYIFHLQRIEDCGIETEDMMGLPDPNETPLKDLIEANSPFISEMLESIGSSSAHNGTSVSSNSCDRPLSDSAAEYSTNDTASPAKVVEELSKMVTELSDELNQDCRAARGANDAKDDETAGMEVKRKRVSSAEESKRTAEVVKTLIEAEEKSETERVGRNEKNRKGKMSALINNEEECTVID